MLFQNYNSYLQRNKARKKFLWMEWNLSARSNKLKQKPISKTNGGTFWMKMINPLKMYEAVRLVLK